MTWNDLIKKNQLYSSLNYDTIKKLERENIKMTWDEIIRRNKVHSYLTYEISDKLERAVRTVLEDHLNFDCIIIVKNGCIEVKDYYDEEY